MHHEHPKPGDETVVFPSQAMDPSQLLASGTKKLKMFPLPSLLVLFNGIMLIQFFLVCILLNIFISSAVRISLVKLGFAKINDLVG